MHDTTPALERNARIEFVCGCAATALILAPLAYCFLYYQVTGHKSGFASAAIVTALATVLATTWAIRGRPSRPVLVFVGVVMPTLVTLAVLWRRAYLLFGG